MQSVEFNNLVTGQPANWIKELNKLKPDGSAPTVEDFKKHAEPVPDDRREEILKYANSLREKGKRERAIRRAVERKFGIKVFEEK